MKNLFESISEVSNAEPTAKINSSSGYLTVYLTVTLSKGGFSEDFEVRGSVENTIHDGYITMDDLEIEGTGSAILNGVVIDNIGKFKGTLINSGLSTVAKSIGFSDEESRKLCLQIVADSQEVKKFFGKKTKVLNALSEKEKLAVYLDTSIVKYDVVMDWFKTPHGIVVLDEYGEVNPKGVPTLEQLIAHRDSLKV